MLNNFKNVLCLWKITNCIYHFDKSNADKFINFCKKIAKVIFNEYFKKIDNYNLSLHHKYKCAFIAVIILHILKEEHDNSEYTNNRFDKNGNIIFNELLKLKNKKNSEDRLKNK